MPGTPHTYSHLVMPSHAYYTSIVNFPECTVLAHHAYLTNLHSYVRYLRYARRTRYLRTGYLLMACLPCLYLGSPSPYAWHTWLHHLC